MQTESREDSASELKYLEDRIQKLEDTFEVLLTAIQTTPNAV